MASSSSSHGQRRKHSDRPRQSRNTLTRSNSSFLGTIKNIVTAPLAWFSNTDDFEDSKDLSGKRRRLQAAPTEPNIGEDDRATRNKRIRVHSPTHDLPQHAQLPQHSATPYLDPPRNAFPPPRRGPPPARSSAMPRSSSTHLPSPTLQELSNNLPNGTVRSTLSPMRHLSISRTMSIDPPPRSLSRASSFQNSSQQTLMDVSMEPSASRARVPSTLRRDNSMPPLTLVGRPSFRMRTSMTPQPQPLQREFSEPPTLSSLNANPIFVRPPPEQPSDTRRESSMRPAATLGALVETARSTKSPVRQHSSLLLGPTAGTEHTAAVRQQSAAEKALQELDVYKTPLLPTRLRSVNSVTSSVPASSGLPDMFKSRRASNLVLMQDDRQSSGRLGRRVSGEKAVKNETKPYAGQGGMKKLLARRKKEVEAEEEDYEPEEQIKEQNKDDVMDEDEGKKDEATTLKSTTQSIPPPLPPKSDWYSEVSQSTSGSGSSLRVGRAKTSRNHISRPTSRPVKNTFSAVFEDDADDTMEDDERDKEKKELEESAKRAPKFEIPAGFSFPEVKPLKHDLTNAKEPPISSLPFSLAKPSSSASTVPVPAASAEKNTTLSTTFSYSPHGPHGESTAPLFAPFSAPPSVEKPVEATESLTSAKENTTSGTGMPNFFAKSSTLAKSLEIKPPPRLDFGLGASSTTAAPAFSFSAPPVKDKANPLWDGEKAKVSEAPKPLWGASNDSDKITSDAAGIAPTTSTLFGSTQTNTTSSQSAGTFSGSAFAPIGGDSAAKSVTSGNLPERAIPAPEAEATKAFAVPKPADSGFTSTTSLFGDATKQPTISTNGVVPAPNAEAEAPKVVAPFGTSAPTPVSAPFSFGTPATTQTPAGPSTASLFGKPPAKVKNSLPAFGDGFNFGKHATVEKESEKEKPGSSAFSFAPSPAPATSDNKPGPAFTFEAPSTASPAPSTPPISFSFGGGGSSTTETSSPKPFAFGLPSSTPAVERPTTPPRNPDQEFRMEESPTREMQQSNESNKPVEPRPTLGFSFGTSAPPSNLFGGQATPTTTTSPFSFGSATPTTNPFAAKEPKPEEPKPFGGFGASSTTPIAPSSGFSFGANGDASSASEPPRPSTAGSFSFNSAPTSASGPAPFSFGAPSTSTGNPFGQPQTSSAPSSPSTFGQASPFAFGQPAAQQAPAAPFGFGSQPASPAGVGAPISLPTPGTPGGFGSSSGGGFGQPAPSSPFSAPAPLSSTPSSGGGGAGAIFTIGAAPAPNPASRQIKKLPNRRGGKR